MTDIYRNESLIIMEKINKNKEEKPSKQNKTFIIKIPQLQYLSKAITRGVMEKKAIT